MIVLDGMKIRAVSVGFSLARFVVSHPTISLVIIFQSAVCFRFTPTSSIVPELGGGGKQKLEETVRACCLYTCKGSTLASFFVRYSKLRDDVERACIIVSLVYSLSPFVMLRHISCHLT